MFSQTAHAAEVTASGTCGDTATWSLTDDGVLTISGTGAMTDYTYQSYLPWYEYRASIVSVNISEGITTVGDRAFYDCTSLASIAIPDGVTSIGTHAFYSCTSLTSVTVPDSVTGIDPYAFVCCTSLTSITIPDGVTSIGESTFNGCTSLTSIAIPDGVTSIDRYAFADCTSLTAITIPDSVTSIGNAVFYDCTLLTSITIPDSVTSIGTYAFYVTSGNGVKLITSNPAQLVAGTHYYAQKTTVIGSPYTLTLYDTDGVSVIQTYTDVAYDQAVTLPSGFWADKNGTLVHDTYIKGESADTAVSLSVTPAYTVTFVDWDGSVIETQYVPEGTAAAAPTSPTRDGYTFVGWDTSFDNITADTVVTAQYMQSNFSVTYQYSNVAPAGAGGLPAGGSYDAGTTVTVADAPTIPAGYTFSGWTTSDASVTDGSFVMPNNAVVFTGSWTANADTAYFVQHHLQNLDGTYSLQETEDLSGTTGTSVTATARAYEGFALNSTHTGQVSEGVIQGDGSTVLKLYYDRLTYTIIFKGIGGVELGSQTVMYGGDAVAPDASCEGYVFSGWDTDFSCVTSNLTVTAVYQVVPVGAQINGTPKNEYQAGEKIDVSSITLTVELADGTLKTVNGSSCSVDITKSP